MSATSPYVARHGDVIDLGPCLTGTNLNLLVLRGFTTLNILAEISAPDVFDQETNKTGTQRGLKRKHAQECYDYAFDALSETAEEKPCTFPEIILNARQQEVIEIYNLEDVSEVYDLSSFSDLTELESPYVGVRVLAKKLDYPKPTKQPQISRVDGNHRLYVMDSLLEKAWKSGDEGESDQDYPVVPFTFLLDLDHSQEAKLFRDINGEHQGMETAHLDHLTFRIMDEDKMKYNSKLRPLWMAHRLTDTGRAFEGMVFFGGAKTGVKKSKGQVPPIRLNALKSTISIQLRSAPVVMSNLQGSPDQLLELVDRFWKAVKELFPKAWVDKKNYILLQAIGLGAFAKFGGIILDRAYEADTVGLEDIKTFLGPVAKAVDLHRTTYPGIAGAGGAQVIADLLIHASADSKVKTQKIINALTDDVSKTTILDEG